MEAVFFAVQDPVIKDGWVIVRELLGDIEYLVAGGFMGAEAGHPIMRRYVDALSQVKVKQLTPTWVTTGGVPLTKVIGEDPDAEILPPGAFFDRTLQGERVIGEEPYARHFWSSTAGRDQHHSGAVPYPGQLRGSVPEEYDARTGARSLLYKVVRRVKRIPRRLARVLVGRPRE
jgi:hypothetical protein